MPSGGGDATRERLAFLFGGVIYNVRDSRVGSKPELEDAARHLDELGIAHERIKDIGVMYILKFRDPDNIALELTAPK